MEIIVHLILFFRAIIFLPMALAITTIINERNDGVWERTIISGVKPIEILICHLVTLSFTSAIQTLECFLFSYYVFGFECEGNIFYAILLLYLIGLVGVSMGNFCLHIYSTLSSNVYIFFGFRSFIERHFYGRNPSYIWSTRNCFSFVYVKRYGLAS